MVCNSEPKGEELAQKSFNPRLGIVGGISILGTTGIVEPMSEAALIKTIHIEMDNRLACGQKKLLITPGNYGQAFAKKQFGFDLAKGVQCSNYIGETLDYAAFKKVEAVLLIGHAGKLVKIAAGVMNTHSHVADARAEVLAAHAAMAGAKKEQVQAIMACATTDAMQQLLTDWGLDQIVWQSVLQKVMLHLRARTHGELPVETVIFNQDVGILAHSKGAFALAKQIKEEMQ